MNFKGRPQEIRLGVLVGLLQLIGVSSAWAESQGRQVSPAQKPAKLTVDRNATPVTIAFISYANPQQVAKDTEAVVAYLEPYVGVRIKGYVTTDYGSSIEAMRSGLTDLAFVDPLAFMMAHEQIGAVPLVLEVYPTGNASYYSCIWVRRDSGIKTLTDLKGKVIAFADQVDMSGHLMPRDIFVQQNLLPPNRLEGEFFKQVYFAGGDEQAVQAVRNGFVDAAGVSQFAYMLLRPEHRDELTVIGRSVDIPAHLLMARKGFRKELANRIRQALLSLDAEDSSDNAILQKLYGVQGFAEASLADFETAAQIAARYGFIKRPALFSAKTLE